MAGLFELAALLLGALLLAGCDTDTITEPEPPAALRFQLDLEAFAPPGVRRAGDCLTIMDRAILRIDGAERGRLSLTPSDTLQVTFSQVPVAVGAEIEVEIQSNNGTALFVNRAVYGGQPQVALAVVPQAPVLWVCPAAIAVETATTFQVMNRGVGALAWSLAVPPALAVTPAQGRVSGDETMRVQVARQGGAAASITLRVETAEGAVALPVQVGANAPPVLVQEIGDTFLEPGGEASGSLAPFFEDPENDPLTFTATSSNPDVATVSLVGELLTVSAGIEGTAEVTVTAADPFNPPVEATFRVIVEDGNSPPVLVQPIPDQTMVPDEQRTLDLLPFFSDPDNDPLTFAATSSNNNVVQVNTSGNLLELLALASGAADVTVTATDPSNATVEDVLRVSVQNAQPVDLLPRPLPNIQGPLAYCRITNGLLEVLVENTGPGTVQNDYSVQVEFSPGGSQLQVIDDPLGSGATQSVLFVLPANCLNPDCDFIIVIDPNDEVDETDEGNNVTDGLCTG